MKLYVLYAQRKCRYPGEYGLEALACMSDNELSENPGYLLEQRDINLNSDQFDSVEIVELNVGEADVRGILFPAHKSVEASVVTPEDWPSGPIAQAK